MNGYLKRLHQEHMWLSSCCVYYILSFNVPRHWCFSTTCTFPVGATWLKTDDLTSSMITIVQTACIHYSHCVGQKKHEQQSRKETNMNQATDPMQPICLGALCNFLTYTKIMCECV